MTARKTSATATAIAKAKASASASATATTGVHHFVQDDELFAIGETVMARFMFGGELGDVGDQGFGGWGVEQGYYVLVVDIFLAVG